MVSKIKIISIVILLSITGCTTIEEGYPSDSGRIEINNKPIEGLSW